MVKKQHLTEISWQTTWWATYYKLENVTKNITKWNCTEKVA